MRVILAPGHGPENNEVSVARSGFATELIWTNPVRGNLYGDITLSEAEARALRDWLLKEFPPESEKPHRWFRSDKGEWCLDCLETSFDWARRTNAGCPGPKVKP